VSAPGRIHAFDWLRGVAVVVMIQTHSLVLLQKALEKAAAGADRQALRIQEDYEHAVRGLVAIHIRRGDRAGALTLVEPLVNTVAHYFFDRWWERARPSTTLRGRGRCRRGPVPPGKAGRRRGLRRGRPGGRPGRCRRCRARHPSALGRRCARGRRAASTTIQIETDRLHTLASALQTLVVAGTLECPTMDAFVPL